MTVVSPDEKKALDWAVNYFRKCADELTADASRRFYEKKHPAQMLALVDAYPEEKDYICAMNIRLALERNPWHIESLCRFVAMLIERGDELPESIRPFLAEFLRGNIKPRRRKPGPNGFDLRHRDILIFVAIDHIKETWKLPATRQSGRDGTASAASIIKEALQTAAKLHLSEAAIGSIFNKIKFSGRKSRIER